MVDVDRAVIARLSRGGKEFQILVDCENAIEFRKGNRSLDEALATEDIYEDVKKGKHASANEIKNVFGTSDQRKIAEIIIKEGNVQLTAEYQNKLREKKIRQIINTIHRNAVDPNTNIPHPPQRIENAIKELKIRIDDFKSVDEQVPLIISKLRTILPIKYEMSMMEIRIPASYAAKSYSILKRFGRLQKEQWQNNGSLLVNMEIPAGLQQELLDHLNNITHGEIETKKLK